mmetsp:Transcript_32637/g.64706  ORF Transcript_32637/g.64706 Transcript_32637/m.64706 type:complete len:223 (+) Transcript_32637:905-1573(+)
MPRERVLHENAVEALGSCQRYPLHRALPDLFLLDPHGLCVYCRGCNVVCKFQVKALEITEHPTRLLQHRACSHASLAGSLHHQQVVSCCELFGQFSSRIKSLDEGGGGELVVDAEVNGAGVQICDIEYSDTFPHELLGDLLPRGLRAGRIAGHVFLSHKHEHTSCVVGCQDNGPYTRDHGGRVQPLCVVSVLVGEDGGRSQILDIHKVNCRRDDVSVGSLVC